MGIATPLPADMGLYPDNMEAPEAVTATEVSPSVYEGLSLRMALATPAFWLIAIAFLTSHFSHVGVIQNQAPHLEDIGFPAATAAFVLGIVGLASAIGKFVFGWLCDWIPAKYVVCIGFGLQSVSIAIFIGIGPDSPLIMIWLYAILIGLGVGSWLPAMSMVVSTNLGLASYGAIFGLVSFAHSLGSGTGPLMVGYMYDNMNTYHWAFVISLALYLIAIPAILAVRRPKSG